MSQPVDDAQTTRTGAPSDAPDHAFAVARVGASVRPPLAPRRLPGYPGRARQPGVVRPRSTDVEAAFSEVYGRL